MRTEAYAVTPPGMIDLPFMYVFDGRTLADGEPLQNLSIQIDGDTDFLLRRIMSVPSVAPSWLYYNPSREQAISDLLIVPNNQTVVPQKLYPASSDLAFDLGTVARTSNACAIDGAILTSFIGFQGVRRRLGSGGFSQYRSSYDYKNKPMIYTLPLTVNFGHYTGAAGNIEAVRNFEIAIENFDFELQWITIVNSPAATVLSTDDFNVQLYDASGYQQLSSRPVPASWLNTDRGANFFSVFPVPTLVYPAQSSLRIGIESFLCTTDLPRNYTLAFHGVERLPA